MVDSGHGQPRLATHHTAESGRIQAKKEEKVRTVRKTLANGKVVEVERSQKPEEVMVDSGHRQPRLATHHTAKSGRIQAKKAEPKKEEKVRTVRKTLANGKVVEVEVKKFSPNQAVQMFMDAFGMTVSERNIWFKENPEFAAVRKELGRRFNAVIEDGKPLDRRVVNKVRNAPGAATIGVVASAFVLGMAGWTAYDKYGDYKASNGL